MSDMLGYTITNEDLKRDLPIPFVLAEYGYDPVEQRGGKLHYINPWRDDDDHPSLDVFVNDEGVQRVGDYAIGFQGSVLDVIQAHLSGEINGDVPWAQLMKEARRLYVEFSKNTWDGPEVVGMDQQGMDPELVDMLLDTGVADLAAFDSAELLSRPGLANTTWFDAFDCVVSDGRLIAPYPNEEAVRIRYATGDKMFVLGSKPGLYHDGNLDDNDKPVLLVEGETDTWSASVALPDWQVVGIPGVGHQPAKHAKDLENKRVTIAFDGDDRGREGAERWLTHLRAAGCTVEVVPMPDSTDLSSMDSRTISELIKHRRTVLPDESNIESMNAGYVVMPTTEKGETRALCNWTLRPLRQLRIDGENTALEVQVQVNGRPTGDPLVLLQEDMASAGKLADWAAQFNGGWLGGARDHQLLRMHLNAKAAYLPLDQGTHRPGLHNMTFAWPGGYLGQVPVRVVPDGKFPYSSPDAYRLRKVPGAGPQTLEKLYLMHRPDLMAPILAWSAMAPLRSLYSQFPACAVTGPAGSGKSTICDLVTKYFSGNSLSTNLTNTTPYALAMMMGGTNSFITFFDEFRPGANKSALEMMKQLIRDAYTGSPSRRGGLSSNLSEVAEILTENPLLISGEDFADEQSHRDRLVKVFLPKGGKGELPNFDTQDEGFAFDYLSWLTERYQGEDDSVLQSPPDPWEHEHLYRQTGITDRQRWNMSVLDCGWKLLNDYCFDRGMPGLFDGYKPTWENLIEMAQDEGEEDVVISACRLVMDNGRFGESVFVEDGHLYISSSQVIVALKALRMDHLLPFASERGLTMHLKSVHDGQSVTRAGLLGGARRRYIKVSADSLDI